MKTSTAKNQSGQILEGTIVSCRSPKTVVVLVERFVRHSKYGKYRVISKKYKAHYDIGQYTVGERLKIKSCRPISGDKHFMVVK